MPQKMQKSHVVSPTGRHCQAHPHSDKMHLVPTATLALEGVAADPRSICCTAALRVMRACACPATFVRTHTSAMWCLSEHLCHQVFEVVVRMRHTHKTWEEYQRETSISLTLRSTRTPAQSPACTEHSMHVMKSPRVTWWSQSYGSRMHMCWNNTRKAPRATNGFLTEWASNNILVVNDWKESKHSPHAKLGG
jgi:hypothetical protein